MCAQPAMEAHIGNVNVVDESRPGKGNALNTGDLPGQEAPRGAPAEVRAAIVAMKSGNADGAKGGRETNASGQRNGEGKPSKVPATDKQGGEDLWKFYGAERGIWSEKMLAALHAGVKGNKWFSLIDKVYADRTLERAWEKVQANAGACGIDGITVGHFAKDTQTRLLAVKEHLKAGTYQSKPVKRVWIPKLGSAEKRPLGIPVVRDRVVQAAVKMVIEPIFEREFCAHSYGFRLGRSCRDALRRVAELLKSGYVHVVDIDIKGYFDAIPHGRLMAQVEEHVADGRVLKLIEMFLKQGVLEEMNGWTVEEGTPQGGVISPLLANIYLNPLDGLMERAGLEMVRYADDMVILCRDRATAEGALNQVRRWMEAAQLELHPEKTKIVDLTQVGSYFDFLGYRFWRGKRGNLLRLIRPKSRMKLRERLKPFLRRANGHSLEAIIRKLNPSLRGFYGYFQHASALALDEVDRWVRGRLRSILRKRRKLNGRARGSDHLRWKNCYFAELGLFSLKQTQAKAIASLRNGVTW